MIPNPDALVDGTDEPAFLEGTDGAGDYTAWSTVAELGPEPDGLLVGTVDLDATGAVRAGYGSQLRDRRPELYAAVCAPATAPIRPPSSPERS